MKLKFLGGIREVGRSAILVNSDAASVLLDYGVMVDHEPGFPIHVSPKEIDAVALTHAHLDHCGAIPLFYVNGGIPLYGTRITFDLAKVIILDFIHLSSYYLPFEYIDLETMLSYSVGLEFGEPAKVKDLSLELLNSGHIPGGSQIIVKNQNKCVLYTGDINSNDTHLLKGADQYKDKVNALIIESTYATEDHPDRESIEREFIESTLNVLERGGTVLIPAFSLGRSQEILCTLAANHLEYPITLDGMAKEVSEILMRYPNYVKDSRLLTNALHEANWVHGWKDRRLACKKGGVVISPAGMLKGGAAMYYMNTVSKKSENAIFLVSYQIPGTPGRRLLDTKEFLVDGRMRKVKAELKRFDFSSHCGRKELMGTVKKTNIDGKVFVVHGEEESCEKFAESIKTEFGFDAVAPKAGEVFEV
jgi:putative mRNA 3-end processing factor